MFLILSLLYLITNVGCFWLGYCWGFILVTKYENIKENIDFLKILNDQTRMNMPFQYRRPEAIVQNTRKKREKMIDAS